MNLKCMQMRAGQLSRAGENMENICYSAIWSQFMCRRIDPQGFFFFFLAIGNVLAHDLGRCLGGWGFSFPLIALNFSFSPRLQFPIVVQWNHILGHSRFAYRSASRSATRRTHLIAFEWQMNAFEFSQNLLPGDVSWYFEGHNLC